MAFAPLAPQPPIPASAAVVGRLDAVEATLALEVTLDDDLREADVHIEGERLIGGCGTHVQNLRLAHAERLGVFNVQRGGHLVALVVDRIRLKDERSVIATGVERDDLLELHRDGLQDAGVATAIAELLVLHAVPGQNPAVRSIAKISLLREERGTVVAFDRHFGERFSLALTLVALALILPWQTKRIAVIIVQALHLRTITSATSAIIALAATLASGSTSTTGRLTVRHTRTVTIGTVPADIPVPFGPIALLLAALLTTTTTTTLLQATLLATSTLLLSTPTAGSSSGAETKLARLREERIVELFRLAHHKPEVDQLHQSQEAFVFASDGQLVRCVPGEPLLRQLEQREALHRYVLPQRNRATYVEDRLQILSQPCHGDHVTREVEPIGEHVDVEVVQQLHDVMQKLRVRLVAVVQHVQVVGQQPIEQELQMLLAIASLIDRGLLPGASASLLDAFLILLLAGEFIVRTEAGQRHNIRIIIVFLCIFFRLAVRVMLRPVRHGTGAVDLLVVLLVLAGVLLAEPVVLAHVLHHPLLNAHRAVLEQLGAQRHQEGVQAYSSSSWRIPSTFLKSINTEWQRAVKSVTSLS
uniref:Uncharacterized protein n=1 Tax=Anopheles atroparvus TaxID=41427 RepID=A0A182J759_ANOAO